MQLDHRLSALRRYSEQSRSMQAALYFAKSEAWYWICQVIMFYLPRGWKSLTSAISLLMNDEKCKYLTWVRSQRCACLVTWFCYHLIAKPGNIRQPHLRDLTHIYFWKVQCKTGFLHLCLQGWIWSVSSSDNNVASSSWDRHIAFWDLGAGGQKFQDIR